jgi:DNA-binding HxlR family transcriptional regulator
MRHSALGTKRGWPLASKITCKMKVNDDSIALVAGKTKSQHRSSCPVSISLEIFGDRWSLLIIRDLMVRGFRTFKEFQESGEGIASNILADRLQKLAAAGIITAEPDQRDTRRRNYRLTEKGIDLAPALLELLIWGARHEASAASCAAIETMAKNREQVLAEVRRRWQQRDPTPLLIWRIRRGRAEGLKPAVSIMNHQKTTERRG